MKDVKQMILSAVVIGLFASGYVDRSECKASASNSRCGVDTGGLLLVEPLKSHPRAIDYTDRSLRDVAMQIAGAYGLKYVKFKMPIDTMKKGVLGSGYTGTGMPLSVLLNMLSEDSNILFMRRKDTLVIQRNSKTVKRGSVGSEDN